MYDWGRGIVILVGEQRVMDPGEGGSKFIYTHTHTRK